MSRCFTHPSNLLLPKKMSAVQVRQSSVWDIWEKILEEPTWSSSTYPLLSYLVSTSIVTHHFSSRGHKNLLQTLVGHTLSPLRTYWGQVLSVMWSFDSGTDIIVSGKIYTHWKIKQCTQGHSTRSGNLMNTPLGRLWMLRKSKKALLAWSLLG